MKIREHKFTAPSYWASALIYGDYSGLDGREEKACRAWAETLPGEVIDAGGESFFAWWHDAIEQCPYGADCCEYTIAEYL